MMDVSTFALLKRGVALSGDSAGESNPVVDARIENGHLILVFSDGTEIDCGALPAAGIDDAIISTDTTWSSARIVEYIGTPESGALVTEERVRDIALEVAEAAISEYVPSVIIGGTAIASIYAGTADESYPDTIYAMDADGEPIGVDITLERD